MRLGLCLGAWWPEGRSSSSVFQFLPSCSWSACQMAVNGKDGYRGELSLWWFLQLCFCSVWGRWPAEREEQTLRCVQLNARLSAELCSPGLWHYHTTLRCSSLVLITFRERQLSWHHDVSLSTSSKYAASSLLLMAQNHSIVCKFDNRSGAVRGQAVVCVERVEQGGYE